MRINQISGDEHAFLMAVFNDYPNLHGQNLRGYATLNEDTFTEADKQALKEIDKLLRNNVVGYQSFQNFKLSADDRPQIRLQYDYSKDGEIPSTGYNPPFVGVGYILIEELLHGFGVD